MVVNTEFTTRIAGLTVVARQYVGIGTLNVSTPRGELKATSGDYIVAFNETNRIIVGEELFLKLAEHQADTEEPPVVTPPIAVDPPCNDLKPAHPIAGLGTPHPVQPIAGQTPVHPTHPITTPPHPAHPIADSKPAVNSLTEKK